MGASKVIAILVGILILYVSIGWYSNLDYVRVDKELSGVEYPISYDTAKKILVHPVHSYKKYYYQNTYITTYRRTLIPFKYEKVGTDTEKQYYNRS